MLVSFLIAGIVITTVLTLIINLVKKQSPWNALGAFVSALIISFFALMIVGMQAGSGTPVSSSQLSERTYQVAENSGIQIDRTTKFFYLDDEKKLQQFNETVNKVRTEEGGDLKSVRITETRHQVGTRIFPWGESYDEKVIYIK